MACSTNNTTHTKKKSLFST